MSGITLAQAQAQLAIWLAADTAVASGQSFTSVSGKALTRANSAEIRKNIDYWDAKVKELSNASSTGGMKIIGATPT